MYDMYIRLCRRGRRRSYNALDLRQLMHKINDMKQLRVLSISDIREMLNENFSASNKLYVSRGLGIAKGINKVFRGLMTIREPFIVEEARFIMVTSGSIRLNVNLIDYEIRQGMMGYVGSGSIVHFSGTDDESLYDGMGMLMSDDVLRLALHGNLPQSLNGTEANFFVETTAEEQQMIGDIIQALWTVVHQDSKHTEARNALIAAMAHIINDIRTKSKTRADNNSTREREIFDRFIALVNKHSVQEHHLPFYADRLCLSEKYLSTIIRKASGTTAKQWIDRSLITAAKVRLRHTDLQITQIADQLNFANPSFFCKYFKQMVGMSPKEYRMQ